MNCPICNHTYIHFGCVEYPTNDPNPYYLQCLNTKCLYISKYYSTENDAIQSFLQKKQENNFWNSIFNYIYKQIKTLTKYFNIQ